MEEVLRIKLGVFVSKRDEMGNPYLQKIEEESCHTCKRQRKEEEKKEKEHSCLNCKWLISKCYLPIVDDVRYICANPSYEPDEHPVYAYETTEPCDNWKSAK